MINYMFALNKIEGLLSIDNNEQWWECELEEK